MNSMAAESAAGAGPRLYPNIDTAASITDITFRFDKKKIERKNQTQTYTLKIEIGYLARWAAVKRFIFVTIKSIVLAFDSTVLHNNANS